MNLYGFAGGDPVNFTDPFGLYPDCTTLPCPLILGGAAVLGGPLTIFGAGVLAVVSADLAFGSSSGTGAVSTRAAADALSTTFERRKGKSLKKEWEGLHGQPWPPGCVAHHDCPLADGGKDDATNIIPLTPEGHVDHHKTNGDFVRWGGKKKPEPKPDPPQEPKQPDTPR
jgi:hypothetical protein